MQRMKARHFKAQPSTDLARQRIETLSTFYREHRRMPSYAEMTELFGVRSKNAVAKIVTKFEAHGLLLRDGNGHLIPQHLTGVRKLGIVEAGFPSPAEEELGDCISLDELL